MAALCPGVQYGLSSQQNYGENRDLIFVKLTDSALRAIEEYLKNQNKSYNQKPTIKFLGNENGELSFPSVHHGGGGGGIGGTSFSFSMSSTADMEGQGGSFECIKQVGSPRGPLEGLGSIPYKIRIHANDDVYEVTRNRMTEAEDKYKNKCTREIKPNQTDIGRKVKVKQNRAPLHHHPVRREMPSMRESLLKQPSQPSYQPPPPQPPTKPSVTPPTAAAQPPSAIVHSSTNNGHLSNGLGSNHVSSTRPQHSGGGVAKKQQQQQLSVPELTRRPSNSPISSRKPPQTSTPPGGGGSDGGSSGSGQSPTSTLPGSPPLISTTTSSSAVTTSNKRPGFHEGPDGFSYKRQRIAHNAPKSTSYNNNNNNTHHHSDPPPTYHQPPVENNSQRRPVTDSRDASNMNPRSRESPSGGASAASYGLVNGHSNSSYGGGGGTTALDVKRDTSDEEDDDDDGDNDVDDDREGSGKRGACDSHFDVNQEKTFIDSSRSSSPAVKMLQGGGGDNNVNNNKWDRDRDRLDNNKEKSIDNNHHNHHRQNGNSSSSSSIVNNNRLTNGVHHPPPSSRQQQQQSIQNNSVAVGGGTGTGTGTGNVSSHRSRKYPSVTSSTENSIARVSPDSQTEGLANGDVVDHFSGTEKENEYPDYKKQYVTIRDADQRKRYKADFNADYTEYRDLHSIVEKVSRRFAQLEERLKKEDENSSKYKDIKKQIVREYNENKKNTEHQRAKRRFQYLHDKLSHIKRLVMEYDQELMSVDSGY